MPITTTRRLQPKGMVSRLKGWEGEGGRGVSGVYPEQLRNGQVVQRRNGGVVRGGGLGEKFLGGGGALVSSYIAKGHQ